MFGPAPAVGSIFARMNPGSSLPQSFADLIRESPKPVLVDFWAPWCGPCRMVSPVVERIAREFKGRLVTIKVNTDRRPQLAAVHEVGVLPTLLMFHNGLAVMRLEGAHPYESLRGAVEKQLSGI